MDSKSWTYSQVFHPEIPHALWEEQNQKNGGDEDHIRLDCVGDDLLSFVYNRSVHQC